MINRISRKIIPQKHRVIDPDLVRANVSDALKRISRLTLKFASSIELDKSDSYGTGRELLREIGSIKQELEQLLKDRLNKPEQELREEIDQQLMVKIPAEIEKLSERALDDQVDFHEVWNDLLEIESRISCYVNLLGNGERDETAVLPGLTPEAHSLYQRLEKAGLVIERLKELLLEDPAKASDLLKEVRAGRLATFGQVAQKLLGESTETIVEQIILAFSRLESESESLTPEQIQLVMRFISESRRDLFEDD